MNFGIDLLIEGAAREFLSKKLEMDLFSSELPSRRAAAAAVVEYFESRRRQAAAFSAICVAGTAGAIFLGLHNFLIRAHR